jgi:molybdopterin converting factor small subunit
MAQALLRLPVGIAGPEGPSRLECEGATVEEALADCIGKEPRLRTRIFREDGSLWVGVFLNGRHIRQTGGLTSPLADGDEIRILPPIAGG